MADSLQLTNRLPTAGPGMGASVKIYRATLPLATGDLALNAVHNLMDLPPGVTVHHGTIWATDMDTNGTPLLAFNVGTVATPALFFSATTVGRDGSASNVMARAGYGFTTTARTRVRAVVSAAAATAAAGTLEVVLFCTVNDPA